MPSVPLSEQSVLIPLIFISETEKLSFRFCFQSHLADLTPQVITVSQICRRKKL